MVLLRGSVLVLGGRDTFPWIHHSYSLTYIRLLENLQGTTASANCNVYYTNCTTLHEQLPFETIHLNLPNRTLHCLLRFLPQKGFLSRGIVTGCNVGDLPILRKFVGTWALCRKTFLIRFSWEKFPMLRGNNLPQRQWIFYPWGNLTIREGNFSFSPQCPPRIKRLAMSLFRCYFANYWLSQNSQWGP